jgi:hypothetical protein
LAAANSAARFGGPLGDALLQLVARLPQHLFGLLLGVKGLRRLAVGRLQRRNSRLHFRQFRQQAFIALRLCVARHNGFPSAGSSGTLPWRASLAKIGLVRKFLGRQKRAAGTKGCVQPRVAPHPRATHPTVAHRRLH